MSNIQQNLVNHQDLASILELLHLAEKLKYELRHCWFTNGRQESVAEHCWRLGLMVMLLGPKLGEDYDSEKALKMAIIHDIVEAEAGDIPVFDCQEKSAKQRKKLAEEKAIERIRELLGNETGEEFFQLWHEFEDKESVEAKFVTALDKMEAFIQHNESDLSTWLHKEKVMVFQSKWKDDYCKFNPVLSQFNDLLNEESIKKLQANGDDVEALKREAENETEEAVVAN